MSEACKECSRLWDKPLPPQSGCNECYDLLRDFTKALEAKNVELEIEAKKYQLLYRNSLISLVDKDIEIDKVEAKNVELEKELEIAVEALEYYANEHNYSGGYYNTTSSDCEDKAREALAAIKGMK